MPVTLMQKWHMVLVGSSAGCTIQLNIISIYELKLCVCSKENLFTNVYNVLVIIG